MNFLHSNYTELLFIQDLETSIFQIYLTSNMLKKIEQTF